MVVDSLVFYVASSTVAKTCTVTAVILSIVAEVKPDILATDVGVYLVAPA
jgi:hypothetical protein